MPGVKAAFTVVFLPSPGDVPGQHGEGVALGLKPCYDQLMSPDNGLLKFAFPLLLAFSVLTARAAEIAPVIPAGNQTPVAVDPFDQIKQMGRGVNIIGYDPIW